MVVVGVTEDVVSALGARTFADAMVARASKLRMLEVFMLR